MLLLRLMNFSRNPVTGALTLGIILVLDAAVDWVNEEAEILVFVRLAEARVVEEEDEEEDSTLFDFSTFNLFFSALSRINTL